VELKIFVDGDTSDQDLSSLRQWLSRDPELRRVATITVADAGTTIPGAMGLDAASLNAIVSNLLAAGSLVTSILAWKDSHPKSPTIRIEYGDVTAVVEGDSPEAVRPILDALEESAPRSGNPDLD
jgi:Effector Associated Constant Component 1